MQVDVLIIGQGISGTMLSWFLHQQGVSFLVLDSSNPYSASKVAAGVINPVTGRRYVTTWMAEEVLSFASLTYKAIASNLGVEVFSSKSIIDFFPTPQMRNAFVERVSENDTYLKAFPDQNDFNPFFHYEFGCGEVRPAYCVFMEPLLSGWRKKLQIQNTLREEEFMGAELQIKKEGVCYRDITATRVIFCDGVASANNPWFSLLPFSGNKGEALIIECENLSREHIFKKGMLLVPLPEKNHFWVGSNYQWEYENAAPSAAFYESATTLLNQWLKRPFEVLEHKAAIRPATLERRPFVGFHPHFPQVGILNGMGTKGASLAPFFAHQLAQHIVHGFPLSPEADVHRFQRILSK